MSDPISQFSEQLQVRNEGSLITLLSRDPNWLYVYWDISEEKNRAFLAELGEDLWKRSLPALKVTNIIKNESFFVRINEFSDSWYINVTDSNQIYVVEIGRKISENYFIGLSSSNSISTPSSYVSSNTTACFASYTDVKSGRFEIGAVKAYDSYIYNNAAELISGLSSPELYGKNREELSSVSSDSFMKG